MATPLDQTRRGNAINGIIANLRNAADHMVKVHTGVSSRLAITESVVEFGKDVNLQYQGMIAQITDVDYNEAISSLNVQTTQLEAAQRSFVLVRGLSLFSYL
jgi:flagellar hook-associated protein 3 FlgL